MNIKHILNVACGTHIYWVPQCFRLWRCRQKLNCGKEKEDKCERRYHRSAILMGVVRQEVNRSAGRSGFMGSSSLASQAASWMQFFIEGGSGIWASGWLGLMAATWTDTTWQHSLTLLTQTVMSAAGAALCQCKNIIESLLVWQFVFREKAQHLFCWCIALYRAELQSFYLENVWNWVSRLCRCLADHWNSRHVMYEKITAVQ